MCNETSGQPLGHSEGDFVTTKAATLSAGDRQQMSCTVCKEVLESRSTGKKLPKVVGNTLNFTDRELIDWLNDLVAAEIGYTNQIDSSSVNTGYLINKDGEIGTIILNHTYGNNVSAIMIYMPEWETAAALVALIGENIDSDFISYDAFTAYVYDEAYSAASMTTTRINLNSTSEVTVLAPTDALKDIVF